MTTQHIYIYAFGILISCVSLCFFRWFFLGLFFYFIVFFVCLIFYDFSVSLFLLWLPKMVNVSVAYYFYGNNFFYYPKEVFLFISFFFFISFRIFLVWFYDFYYTFFWSLKMFEGMENLKNGLFMIFFVFVWIINLVHR